MTPNNTFERTVDYRGPRHPGTTVLLGPETIHAISNPLPTPARGLQVYGKDLVVSERRMWHPGAAAEMKFDMQVFEGWEEQLSRENRARQTGQTRARR